ncbi:cytoplasmic dynein 1 intermediate chain 2-like isoform X1 [Lytechinus variegatus]|uniref:cytoplasmic dynein 1 intermediate chain 2-like isoform X1 n=1 Tax=Lytechinus variegatus TaxID=7654 RepID=UPI001BB0E6B4|nr:cytoplasmic dynein 1 intermediate chain 2-like isoform X1 [Lytechinus variegatus]XP_041460778.1 cytoplasmic dynein 1 intermediate chain 2-like isoform X1 [Lytechinus variegatus]
MSERTKVTKAELERKRLRLQQIREDKKRREDDKKKEAENAAKAAAASPAVPGSVLDKKRQEADDILRGLDLPESAPLAAISPPELKAKDTSGDAKPRQSVSPAHKTTKLTVSKITQAGFPPKEMVSYSKETQTPTETPEDEDDEPKTESVEAEQSVQEAPKPEEKVEEEKPEVPKEYTEEEKAQLESTEAYQVFVEHSVRLMERALSENVDIFIDYEGKGDGDGEGDKDAGAKLSLNRSFSDERWSRHRVVTCLDWSNQYPELLVASYNNNEESPHEPDGVALIWNMKYKKQTPEYIFHCQSAVMSAGFANFHPNMVIGGTYSGQIVLWDNRSSKRTPVQRTPLSAAAHTHPVYCVNVVGTQNAHNLISISTDGKMCSWSLDMLSQPQDSMELKHKQSKPVAVMSMTFPSNDVNNFVVGSEDGSVYTASRHGSKAGINEAFEAHQGPVTGIDCHHVPGQLDFSHLFLSSSFDWTIKLWSLKKSSPVYSFEDNSDYVYDVEWSPSHPALFAAVDGMGRVDLWNLNNDTEVPTASVTLDGQPAANRVKWGHQGNQIAVGDAEGKIWIYDVGESLAMPRNDEWSKFVRTLADIRANTQTDTDEEASR